MPLHDPTERSEFYGERLTPQQIAFLRAYLKYGVLSKTHRATGTGKSTHYKWLEIDTAYIRAFESVKADVVDDLTRVAMDRATKGWEEPVYQQGMLCGHKRKFSDTLLMFVLKKLDPSFRDSGSQTTINVGSGASQRDIQAVISDAKQDPQYLQFLRNQGLEADETDDDEFADLLG